ncbi:uncharacterized protein Dwil_GK27585 [Drosophila willistoni]|uniref:Uncharacterized protein n=1 Tax=Drosophila willistoni TaxID=7260 RepID=A0A0Q9WWW3_DROWI|nr:uncharacterized protein Dwil_GK27585 [Drosophila willistoni]
MDPARHQGLCHREVYTRQIVRVPHLVVVRRDHVMCQAQLSQAVRWAAAAVAAQIPAARAVY